jgi:uncharacterized phage-associated protein
MLSRKKKNITAVEKQTKDVVQINKVVVDKYRRIGHVRIRLVSEDKGPWKVSISHNEQPYSFLTMKKDEFKDMLLEIKDMMGEL